MRVGLVGTGKIEDKFPFRRRSEQTNKQSSLGIEKGENSGNSCFPPIKFTILSKNPTKAERMDEF